MRKNFQTKEYTKENVFGTFNMKEIRSFLMSKILEIEDIMVINNLILTWNESYNNTQGILSDNITKTYNFNDIKRNNHSISLTPKQSDIQTKEYTSWDININIREIVNQYLFAQLKVNKAFSKILNEHTYFNSVNKAIFDYIEQNVYPRIIFDKIVLYVKYIEVDNNRRLLNVQYNSNINTSVNDFRLVLDTLQNNATVTYKQILSSENYTFDYYFDVIWRKS